MTTGTEIVRDLRRALPKQINEPTKRALLQWCAAEEKGDRSRRAEILGMLTSATSMSRAGRRHVAGPSEAQRNRRPNQELSTRDSETYVLESLAPARPNLGANDRKTNAAPSKLTKLLKSNSSIPAHELAVVTLSVKAWPTATGGR